MIDIVFDKRFEHYLTERAPLASSPESGVTRRRNVVVEVNRNGGWSAPSINCCLWRSLQAATRGVEALRACRGRSLLSAGQRGPFHRRQALSELSLSALGTAYAEFRYSKNQAK